MSDAILTLNALGVLALGAVAYLSLRHLQSLRASLPDSSLVQKLAASQQALTQSIEAQRQITEELPRAVSDGIASEVRTGLVPFEHASQALSQELARSHDGFTQAVLTLNHDGSLGEWVECFREALRPFQDMNSAVGKHYETTKEVLETTGKLVEQWAAQREAVVAAFNKFREEVALSAAHEAKLLANLEPRLMDRLAEVADTNAIVAQGLSELQAVGRDALEINSELGRRMEAIGQQVTELMETRRQIQSQHLDLIRAQQQVQKDLVSWQKRADQGLSALHESIGRLTKETDAALESIRQETQGTVATLTGQLEGFHREYAKVVKAHEALAQRQESILDRASNLLHTLPTRQHQILTLALFGAQLVLMLVLIWRVAP